MVINGVDFLDINDYEGIIINLKDNHYVVDVTGNHYFKVEKTGKSFTETINDLDDEKKFFEIVRYYLRNNKINEVINKTVISDYKGTFKVVCSSCKRILAINSGIELSNKINNAIMDKYYFDRYEYCFNNDIKEILCSYGLGLMKYGETLILSSEYDKFCDADLLSDIDYEFLKKLLLDKFDYKTKASIKYETKKTCFGFSLNKAYLINGKLKIDLGFVKTTTLINYIYKIIYYYNNDLQNLQSKQLKLKI